MSYQGDIALGQTLDFNFTTRQISGAPSTLSGSPVLSCYVGNSTTEITAGITLSVDFDSRTGLNHVRIVASGGNGYATASDYSVVITTGTVNSVSVVSEVVAEFSIENRQANVKFWNGTAVATPATAGIPDVNVKNMNNVSGAAITTVKAVQGLTTADTIATYTGNTPQTGDAYARLGAPAGASTAADIAAINTKTTNLPASPAAVGSAMTLTAAYDAAKTAAQAGNAMALTSGERDSTADALLARNVAGGSSAGRLVKEALYVLRNKTDISAGTLTVYGTDDSTAAFTAAVTTTAGNPISQIDPA